MKLQRVGGVSTPEDDVLQPTPPRPLLQPWVAPNGANLFKDEHGRIFDRWGFECEVVEEEVEPVSVASGASMEPGANASGASGNCSSGQGVGNRQRRQRKKPS